MTTSAIKSIPLDLRKELSDYHTPWGISDRICNKMRSHGAQVLYKKIQVLPTDPEWRFIWRYFHHDKPNQYRIKRIYCINKIQQQQAFELNLSSLEREAKTFQPTWRQEPRATQRAQAIELWRQTSGIFSPFSVMKGNERENFEYAKIIPLWYISSKAVCNSGSESDFVYFGKTSESQNNGYDFSENGIYFTNSARYASDVYNEKNLFLAWVSMKEPFPIVGDYKTDIETFKETYKDYNAYYVPVTSINSSDNDENRHYSIEEKPHCDEFVVFHKSQTLPCFYVELEVELPYVFSDTPQFVNELIPHFMKLLQNPNVDSDQKLRNYLCKELELLLTLEGDNYLEERQSAVYEQIKQLLDSQGKVNMQVSCALTETNNFDPIISQLPQPTRSSTSSTSDALVSSQTCDMSASFTPTNATTVSSNQVRFYPSVSEIAFGKADWERFFGDIDLEPALPENIEKILNEPCTFWPNKKVKDTHLLVLIPNKVNEKPFTLNYLADLIQKPRSGYTTKYRYYSDYLRNTIGNQSYPSHWVLITKDVIPYCKGKHYSKCCKLVADHVNRTGIPYELPHELDAATSILMHHVKTGDRLYKPGTYTFSKNLAQSGRTLVVGGFSSEGFSVSGYFCGKGAAAGARMF